MRLVIFDDIQTLVKPATGQFINRADQIQVIEAAQRNFPDAHNTRAVVLSNQGGVELGHMTLEEAARCLKVIADNFPIDFCLFCPQYRNPQGLWYVDRSRARQLKEPALSNDFRKPSISMVKEALILYPANNFDEIVVVGDGDEDKQLAINGGFKFTPASLFHSSGLLANRF